MSVFLETPRLVLRDNRQDDLPFHTSLRADPRVMRWIGDGQTFTPEESAARFERYLEAERAPGHERWNGFKIIQRKSDQTPVGGAGLLRCEIDGAPDVEIGWWLAPFAWGHGYATEAALAFRDYAFDVLLLGHLSVVLDAQNTKSVAVAKRIGGVYDGIVTYRDRKVTRYIVRPQPG